MKQTFAAKKVARGAAIYLTRGPCTWGSLHLAGPASRHQGIFGERSAA